MGDRMGIDLSNFSHDISKHPALCPRCRAGMRRLGEMVVCDSCGSFVVVNQAAQTFQGLAKGTMFILPAAPRVVFQKFSYGFSSHNAENITRGGYMQFPPNELVIPAQWRLMAGLFSYN